MLLQIGVQHGSAAQAQIKRSISFYQALFKDKSKMDWNEVTPWAEQYMPYLTALWPHYVSEMRGVASGAGVPFLDILAMNVRTEIAFGTFSDGCTALSWKSQLSSSDTSILAQNWDWNTQQSENLISLKLVPTEGPRIHMITEAGIIGKIGMNSAGVGCTLNALKARGVAFDRLPCHLALRTVMASTSREEAIATLEAAGVASACHILVADETGGTGLECSSVDIVQLEMSEPGIVTHTNHYIAAHAASVVEAEDWLPDTRYRLKRIDSLLEDCSKGEGPSLDVVERLLKDDVEGDGAAICRTSRTESPLATLFSVVMDMGLRKGRVTIGRPSHPEGKIELLP